MYTFNNISAAWRKGAAVALTMMLGACISNDLPYPWVQPTFKTFEIATADADGYPLQSMPVEIDSAAMTITINLSEYADRQAVPLTDWSLSEGSVCLNPEVLTSPLNLEADLSVNLQLYDRTFAWTIQAEQNIERYFTVGSQIGTSVIDAEAHTVNALVPEAQPLNNIAVRTIKLAGPLATMSPDLAGQHVDFTDPVEVTVTEFGRETVWTITIEQTAVSVDLERVDAWTNVAWLYGNAQEGKANGFEYRRATDQEWTAVPAEWITVNGGSFYARLIHLEAMTDYVARATSDDEHSAEVEFTTGSIIELPNSQFQDWWLNGKVWNPWSQDGESFWDSGNRGAATLGQSNTLPMSDPTSPTGYAGAELQTKFIGVSVLGKLGAGNIFTGSYVRTDGTNGVLSFGRDYAAYPTRLTARINYTPVAITHASKTNPDFQYMLGQPDTCIVWCALGDWDEPFEVRTKPTDRQLFSPDDPGVIAYGQVQFGQSTNGYVDINVDLDYKSTSRRPKYIIVTASASKYGDYFTGGNGSILLLKWVDLQYDY